MVNCYFTASSLTQGTAIVSSSQFVQGELCRPKVVHACFQIDKISTNNVNLNFVECPRASCGAKMKIAARMFPMPSDPGA